MALFLTKKLMNVWKEQGDGECAFQFGECFAEQITARFYGNLHNSGNFFITLFLDVTQINNFSLSVGQPAEYVFYFLRDLFCVLFHDELIFNGYVQLKWEHLLRLVGCMQGNGIFPVHTFYVYQSVS